MVMTIHPLSNRVLIERNKVDDVSSGGILLPGNTDKKEKRGVIIEVGPECEYLTAGDKVIFADYTGTLISSNGKHFAVIPESEIVATYTE